MPYRKLEILVGAAYLTSGGNWEKDVIYLNNYAWKQILYGDEERSIKSVDNVKLELGTLNNCNVIIVYNENTSTIYNLRCEQVVNSLRGNGMVYFYLTTKLSKWSAN